MKWAELVGVCFTVKGGRSGMNHIWRTDGWSVGQRRNGYRDRLSESDIGWNMVVSGILLRLT